MEVGRGGLGPRKVAAIATAAAVAWRVNPTTSAVQGIRTGVNALPTISRLPEEERGPLRLPFPGGPSDAPQIENQLPPHGAPATSGPKHTGHDGPVPNFEEGGVCPPGSKDDYPVSPPYVESKDIHLGEGYKVPDDIFHPGGRKGLKDKILKDATAAGTKWKGKLGKNPDVRIQDGKIVLQGQGKYSTKKPIETNLDPADYPEISR